LILKRIYITFIYVFISNKCIEIITWSGAETNPLDQGSHWE